ncbi:MAG: FtsW/RodA/SpoVE family cell cycle protein [Lachnospiraceae bacterium]|nr:FtsW/RodA/SpoVE family cell cycle protein [Lachnospiraceae bacterium]
MQEIIIAISKYSIIILMAFYVYESFQAIRDTDDLKKRKYCFKQTFIMYLVHALCYTTIYLHTLQDKIIIFYGVQLIYFILVIEICKLIYKKYNRPLMNVMCMMLMISFTMLSRLSYDKTIRQFIICVGATIVAMTIAFFMKKVKKMREFSYIYAILGIGALSLVYALGAVTYGAKLSIDLGFVSVQPSEFVKITYVMFISGILYKSQTWKSVLLSGVLAAIHVVVLVFSSDLGTALIFSVVYLFLVFMATGKYSVLFGGLIAGSGAAFVAYKIFDHIKVRVAAWIDPWSIIDNKGYQIAQSLFAIGTGGIFGMGLYEGMPNSIPVVDQDFIFSAISEEFGAIFGICVILLSLNVFLIFIRTAFKCKDDFYRLICAGFAVSYGIQLFLTVGGAIKLIPSTGVTYPLLSYGGSSLMSTIFIFFIVQGVKINEEDE